MKTNTVFVYGSLLKGLPNHDLLSGARFLGDAITQPEFTMVSFGAFPGVIHHGTGNVRGELYHVSPAKLKDLDRLEGNGSFYTRRKMQIGNYQAWIYLLPERYLSSYHPKLWPCDWKHHLESAQCA